MGQSKIKVEHVNPFLVSLKETFTSMVGVEAKPGKVILKQDGELSYDISGIIGLSGDAKGMVALCFPRATALAVVGKFVGTSQSDLDATAVDAIGELANIVAGNAKKGLSGFAITISLPSVIMGPRHQVRESKDALSILVPIETELGAFDFTVSLKSE